jgi:HSP20 family protein
MTNLMNAGASYPFDEWDSAEQMLRQQRERDRLRRRAARPGSTRGAHVFPSVIVSTAENSLIVRAEVPGMKLEDFDVTVSGDTLTIEGTRSTGEDLEGGWYHRRERQSGRFSRAVRLPAEVDGDKAGAGYTAGVLTISLPLKEPAKPKEISVKVSEG